MHLVDWILIIALLAFAGMGMKDGFVHTVGRLIGAIVGFALAKLFYLKLTFLLTPFMSKGWAETAVFIIIFYVITRLTGFVVKLLDGLFHVLSFIPFLKTINNLLGLIVGFFEGLIVIGGIIYALKVFNVEPSWTAALVHSSLALWIEGVFTAMLAVLL